MVVELFAGICSGLEMVLRSGLTVSRYIYVDISVSAQKAALARLDQLSLLYPHLLPPAAWHRAFTSLPANVYDVTASQLVQIGARDQEQWVVIAGFECQDLSPAGQGRGLQGRRSSTFYSMLSVLGTLQSLQVDRPPLYLVENTASVAISNPTQHKYVNPMLDFVPVWVSQFFWMLQELAPMRID